MSKTPDEGTVNPPKADSDTIRTSKIARPRIFGQQLSANEPSIKKIRLQKSNLPVPSLDTSQAQSSRPIKQTSIPLPKTIREPGPAANIEGASNLEFSINQTALNTEQDTGAENICSTPSVKITSQMSGSSNRDEIPNLEKVLATNSRLVQDLTNQKKLVAEKDVLIAELQKKLSDVNNSADSGKVGQQKSEVRLNQLMSSASNTSRCIERDADAQTSFETIQSPTRNNLRQQINELKDQNQILQRNNEELSAQLT
ncbi:hypothetical protein BOX15_Mlig029970g1, partial [Macrostomum lignano]